MLEVQAERYFRNTVASAWKLDFFLIQLMNLNFPLPSYIQIEDITRLRYTAFLPIKLELFVPPEYLLLKIN